MMYIIIYYCTSVSVIRQYVVLFLLDWTECNKQNLIKSLDFYFLFGLFDDLDNILI